MYLEVAYAVFEHNGITFVDWKVTYLLTYYLHCVSEKYPTIF